MYLNHFNYSNCPCNNVGAKTIKSKFLRKEVFPEHHALSLLSSAQQGCCHTEGHRCPPQPLSQVSSAARAALILWVAEDVITFQSSSWTTSPKLGWRFPQKQTLALTPCAGPRHSIDRAALSCLIYLHSPHPAMCVHTRTHCTLLLGRDTAASTLWKTQYEKRIFHEWIHCHKKKWFFLPWAKKHTQIFLSIFHCILQHSPFYLLAQGAGFSALPQAGHLTGVLCVGLWILLRVGFPPWKQRTRITSYTVLEIMTMKAFPNKHIVTAPVRMEKCVHFGTHTMFAGDWVICFQLPLYFKKRFPLDVTVIRVVRGFQTLFHLQKTHLKVFVKLIKHVWRLLFSCFPHTDRGGKIIWPGLFCQMSG